ncbi:hypothetical protein [Apilactobacillus xinyiensis]|uniref:hypothetical protein n=1 Tax=Apilactobacillus xinyiensis TaxID=2841032 RepID=UPI0020107ECF|nr:hypothetical protein [Apilactobacillus xinyiensis]MCL0330687.1 hypothetical protein [Apilactobacillus xinyiensis]
MLQVNGKTIKQSYVKTADRGLVKFYDNYAPIGKVLWQGPKFFGGYYSRFNKDSIPADASGQIKLSCNFSDLKTGIKINFYPEWHDNTCGVFYNGDSSSFTRYLSNVHYNYSGNENITLKKNHCLPTARSIFISKDDLLSGKTISPLCQFVNVTDDIYRELCIRLNYTPLKVKTNGVDTLILVDSNNMPTSYIGTSYDTGGGYALTVDKDMYLIFDEITSY